MKRNRSTFAVFFLVLCMMAGVLFLRWKESENNTALREDSIVPEGENTEEDGNFPISEIRQSDAVTIPAFPEEENQNPAAESPKEAGAEMPQPSEEKPPALPETETPYSREESPYTETSYQLVTDLVFTRRHMGDEGEEEIQRLLAELKKEDPALGELWQGIMDYWAYVSSGLTVNPGRLPDGLPDDDSLCIVVLGFQLNPDGSMAPELEGRCEVALDCAQQYPDAWLAVTGGGTAYGNREATEAGVMADWFIEHGIAREKILIEDSSLTTDQNAAFTCELLAAHVPRIRSVAVVSSDYHVALGSMLFEEASLLYGYRNSCEAPYRVISNAGFATSGSPEYSDPARYSSDIWILADPTY